MINPPTIVTPLTPSSITVILIKSKSESIDEFVVFHAARFATVSPVPAVLFRLFKTRVTTNKRIAAPMNSAPSAPIMDWPIPLVVSAIRGCYVYLLYLKSL